MCVHTRVHVYVRSSKILKQYIFIMHTAYLVKIRQGDIIKSRVKHVDTEMEKYDK